MFTLRLAPIARNTSTSKRGRGRPPVPAVEVNVMRNMRFKGLTLAFIGNMTERSITTVYNYTKDIACARRRNRLVAINSRTGIAALFGKVRKVRVA